jgi:hypothetical protein
MLELMLRKMFFEPPVKLKHHLAPPTALRPYRYKCYIIVIIVGLIPLNQDRSIQRTIPKRRYSV